VRELLVKLFPAAVCSRRRSLGNEPKGKENEDKTKKYKEGWR